MRPLKTLIVDDKKSDLKRLKEALQNRPDIFNVAAEAVSYDQAIAHLSKEIFDLSILDNDLNGYDFRDILSSVSVNRLGLIAVTSIHTNDLLEKVITIRHIIVFPKPHVSKTIDRFILRLHEELAENEKLRHQKFIIKNNKGSYNIACNNIYFIKTKEKAKGIITEFFCASNNKLPTTQFEKIENWESLKSVEEQLDPKIFFRCADNYIINLTKITASKIFRHNRLIFFSEDKSTETILAAVATKMGREYLERNSYVK